MEIYDEKNFNRKLLVRISDSKLTENYLRIFSHSGKFFINIKKPKMRVTIEAPAYSLDMLLKNVSRVPKGSVSIQKHGYCPINTLDYSLEKPAVVQSTSKVPVATKRSDKENKKGAENSDMEHKEKKKVFGYCFLILAFVILGILVI